MKRLGIKRQLKNDLQAVTPSDFDAVWAKCNAAEPMQIKQTERSLAVASANGRGGSENKAHTNARVRLVAVLTAVILVFGMIFGAAMGWFGGKKIDRGYFIFDINPSVEMAYDERGKITSVAGLNEDGKVLLCGVELVGKTYGEATKLLFDGCVRLGYFSAARQDNAVLVSATKEQGGADEEMTARMKALLSDTFAQEKLCGVVITGVDDPTLKDEAALHGVDAQKYALIYSYIQMGGALDEEDYAEISIRELYKKIANLEEALEEEALDELEMSKAQTEEELYELVSDKIEDILEKLQEQIGDVQTLSSFGLGGEHGGHGEPQGNDYRQRLEDLEEYADRIEDARNQGDFDYIIKELLLELDELRFHEKNTTLKELFNEAYEAICEVLHTFEMTVSQIEKLGATAEDQYAAREEKFGKNNDRENEFDWEEWLEEYEEKENDFTSSWYSRKNKWNEDRKRDLDD